MDNAGVAREVNTEAEKRHSASALNWSYPEQGQQEPFLLPITVSSDAIDHYGHVNNAVYLKWLEEAGWAHLNQLEVTLERYEAWDVAMVVHRHELDYVGPAHEGDQLVMATWLERHNRISAFRRFELKRISDGKTLFKAYSHYVCTTMSSGKARRIPKALTECYDRACPSG